MTWTSWCNVILGVWLILAAWVAGFATTIAVTNSFVVGVVVLIAAITALTSIDAARGARWVNLLAGIWLVISPWVLGFSTSSVALGNNVIAGALVAICAFVGLGTMRRITVT